MHCSPIPNRRRIPGALFLLSVLLHAGIAHADETIWIGAATSSSWSDPANWSNGVPEIDDVAIVTSAGNPPTIEAAETLCGGLVLEEDAMLQVLNSGNPLFPYSLFIFGPGDLDGDGVPDLQEGDESQYPTDYDADDDGIPNFAETDSDGDNIGDACEFAYENSSCSQNDDSQNDSESDLQFHPYEPDLSNLDCDGDGHLNAEECSEGSDPTDPDSIPVYMPALGLLGIAVLFLMLVAFSVWMLCKASPRARRVLSVLLAAALVSLGGFMGTQPLLAASSFVDFALGQTVEGQASIATPGDTLEIRGDSIRPWNGASTYLNKPLTLKAIGGPVFLGGMRTTFLVKMLGEGSLEVKSAYEEADHPARLLPTTILGLQEKAVFLGERVALTPQPDTGWSFRHWADDAIGSDNPLQFQALTDGLRATAILGPPGPDLAATLLTGPSGALRAGVTVAANFQIENIGQSDTLDSGWNDGLYLSRDAVFDTEDLELAVTAHTDAVGAGDGYTASFSATLPDVAPGRYHILGVADAGMGATDENRNNNVVNVEVFVLDVNLTQ